MPYHIRCIAMVRPVIGRWIIKPDGTTWPFNEQKFEFDMAGPSVPNRMQMIQEWEMQYGGSFEMASAKWEVINASDGLKWCN